MYAPYIFVLHLSKPFLKYLELRTYRGYNGHHSRNFYCRVWARIKILVSSYKSYDHMSPLEGPVHHIDDMSYIYYACAGMKIDPPNKLWYPWLKKKDGKWRKGSDRGSLSKENWSITGEIARLRSAWTRVEHQMEKWMSAQSSVRTLLVHSYWSCTSLFSHEQRQQCLQS
jgi:hypothetical protein